MFHFVIDWVGRKFGKIEPIILAPIGRVVSIPDDRTSLDLDLMLPPPPRFEDLKQVPPVEPAPPLRKSSREAGHRFHRLEFTKLFEAVGHWETVEFLTAAGTPIGCIADLPRSADGGIDVIIRIVADTEHGARIVAGRIRSLILRQDY